MENSANNNIKNQKPFIIGLCGGIGSGKSAAAQILMRLGAYIIDTDKISKQVMADGSECDSRLKAAFPMCETGGVLQRSMLKNLVFSDENKRKLLNSITHPYILAETISEAVGKELVVIQVPLLFESGFDKVCDITVCIISSMQARLERLQKRDNMSEIFAKSIMAVQLSDDVLRQKCDFVIENSGDMAQLEKEVEEFFQKIQKCIKNHG